MLSLLIGAVAAFFTYLYVNSVEDRAYQGARLVQVFVVSSDIEKNTGGDEALAKGLIKADAVPQKFRPSSAITDPNVVKGKVSLSALTKGQVLVDGMFVDPRTAQVTAAKRIPAGQVAVTVQVDAVKGVAGLVVPGDKVNIMTPRPRRFAAHAVRERRRAIHRRYRGPEAGSTAAVQNPGSNLITFAVPQLAAQKISLAASAAAPWTGIWLTLVPPDNKAAAVPPVNAGNMFSGGPTPYEG